MRARPRGPCGLEAEQLELRCDVAGGQVAAARRGRASFEQVVGQKLDVRGQSRRPGCDRTATGDFSLCLGLSHHDRGGHGRGQRDRAAAPAIDAPDTMTPDTPEDFHPFDRMIAPRRSR